MGEIIDGKYEILREIGRGGMSIVYLAMDKRLNKQWAIKEFRKDKGDESKQVALKALLDEANLMKKLDHPTLPRIVDIIDDKSTVYIVMDYIEGESLNKVLDAYGAQPQEAVIEWGKQLSEVLDYLHTRVPPIIYRDMKPANIMLKPDGTVRLIDFGIAREYKEGKSGDTTNIGTRGYAAPEQFGDKGQTDARTDIYSLGVTLYHLVTGKNPAEPPYEIYPIRHWNPSLSSGLEWLIQKCTQLNPKDRYQSCAEVTYVLENLDKFESAYKRKLKTKVNLFFIMSAMAVVFGIASLTTWLVGNNAEKANYESLMALKTISGYEQAIQANPDRPDAYVELANKLREQISVIHPGEQKEGDPDLPSNEIYIKDIVTAFQSENMIKLRQEDIEAFVSVNYELGRLFWNNFGTGEKGSSDSVTEAVQYFEAVITAAAETDNLGGLSEQKYNLAKSYYLVSYFQSRKKDMLNQDDGSFRVSDAARIVGVYGIKDDEIENPFYSFWKANEDLLELIGSDEDISTAVRLESIEKLVYILMENHADFYNKTKNSTNASERVDGERIEAMFNKLVEITKSLNVSEGDEQDQKQEIIASFSTLRAILESSYKIELEEV